ncbi:MULTISPECIES: flagellar hook protein FlgE [Asticcacaulis]|uniref:flagellar hook protein FlgE n=1 Tax=Asticcacaulis TaxID=76890 RepID=UPI001AE5E14C|nr:MULTISPECIES: flagellar hook-basal body complex protein [Asticcacaulis]MBP2161170.1 flagellar hook protein FlgE [Asticcacaulis solisilvae]MDR6802215.1 flagellar hook protein FlgE [Asticcacaulis sp. BE141]
MLGSIFIGLSGMQAFSKGLQTISNNVANLDTLGYKTTTVSFSDMFGGHANGMAYTNGDTSGSTGNGVRRDADRIDFRAGTAQQTGGALDLAIQGSGFLVVRNELGDTYYVRTGQFAIDTKGYIVNSHGDRLTILNAQNAPEVINVDNKRTSAPVATKTITFSQNLSSSESTATVSNISVFDSNGAAQVWTVSLAKGTVTGSTVEWTVTVKDQAGATIGDGKISFNGGLMMPSASSITVNTTPNGASAMSVKLDFASVTSFSAGTTNTLQASKIDGNAVGSLTSATVNAKGQLVLTYSNSQTEELGAIALADFQDLQQLVRVGNGLFRDAGGDGKVEYKASATGGIGTLQSGQVEASNVDLTAEFGTLILVQRGFGASSQVVSATNDMIQQLFGMRGHG